jgi:hypothetical protein
MIAALLALAAFGPVQDDEPADLFDWARKLDDLDKRWSWGEFEFQLGGEAVLEFFAFGKEAPGVMVEDPALRSGRYRRSRPADSPEFDGRLDLVLDAFYGKWLAASVDGRIDGTTAGQGVVGERIEQAWLRFMIPDEPAFSFEAGKFPAPIGNFIERHDPRKNPLTTWPLPYDDVTAFVGLKEGAGALTVNRDKPDFKDWYVPIWQAVYGTGAMGFGSVKDFSYAVAVMNSAPGTLPENWAFRARDFRYPSLYLHATWAPDLSTKVGGTWSRGPVEHDDGPGVPPGRHAGEFPQTLAGVDLSFSRGSLEMWAEAYWTRFESPAVDALDLWTWYVEAKYTFLPGLFGAVRLAQIYFGDAQGHQWDRDLTRFEVGGGYFFTRNLFVKSTVQVNVTTGGRDPADNLLMIQLGLTF